MAIGSPASASPRTFGARTKVTWQSEQKSGSACPRRFPKGPPCKSFVIGMRRFLHASKAPSEEEGRRRAKPNTAPSPRARWRIGIPGSSLSMRRTPAQLMNGGSWPIEYEDVCLRFRSKDEHTDLLQAGRAPDPCRARRNPSLLTRRGDVDRFLHEKDRVLGHTAMHAFLDVLEGRVPCRPSRSCLRRAEGDWSRDNRPEKFPSSSSPSTIGPRPSSQASPYGLPSSFGLRTQARRSKHQSMASRLRQPPGALWRQGRGEDHPGRSAAMGGQPDEHRAHRSVVHEVWLRAARVIFGWAVSRKRLQSTPSGRASLLCLSARRSSANVSSRRTNGARC